MWRNLSLWTRIILSRPHTVTRSIKKKLSLNKYPYVIIMNVTYVKLANNEY